jgi:hypothetical protein
MKNRLKKDHAKQSQQQYKQKKAQRSDWIEEIKKVLIKIELKDRY